MVGVYRKHCVVIKAHKVKPRVLIKREYRTLVTLIKSLNRSVIASKDEVLAVNKIIT